MIHIGDQVVLQGMPATILAIQSVGALTLVEVLVEVPQVRWVPESALTQPGPGPTTSPAGPASGPAPGPASGPAPGHPAPVPPTGPPGHR